MSNWGMRGGLFDGLAGPLLLGAFIVTGCEGEYRPYNPPQLTSPNQPATQGAAGSASSAASEPSNEGQIISPSNLSPSESADGTDRDGDCASNGTCPPVSLCEGDAGACEATCP